MALNVTGPRRPGRTAQRDEDVRRTVLVRSDRELRPGQPHAVGNSSLCE
jgi:hypothetical protein